MNGVPYGNYFNVGEYTITSSNVIFGDSATGTLSVLSEPIPEPSTYAALTGVFILGLVVLLRRRRA